jgi:hypothetical protein
MDLRNKIVSLVYSPNGLDATVTQTTLNSMKGNLEKLELWCEDNASNGNDGHFLVGNTYVYIYKYLCMCICI